MESISIEIKFRAWDESQKYMAYQGMPDLETIQCFMHHFGDKELMQFIGLKDKNGKDIFEGDFLKTKYGIGKVCWDEQYLNYYILFDTEDSCASDNLDIGWSKEIEVIGNIYETI